MTVEKSKALAETLLDNTKRLFADLRKVGQDADGSPILAFGTLAIGSQSALVRIKNYEVSGNTSFLANVPQQVYAPHVVQLVLESSAVAGTALLSAKNMARLMTAVGVLGIARTEVYLSPAGNAVDVADITPVNLVDSFGQKYGIMAGQ
jgi:hypothetical protein